MHSDDVTLERRSSHRLSSEGPRVAISLSWERSPCVYGSRVYDLSLCSAEKVCIRNREFSENYKYEYSDEFPLLFWTTYTFDMQAFCESTGFTAWTTAKISTGPGGNVLDSQSLFHSSYVSHMPP